jgi:alkanesulfonate monooxygenase SsuD/methylene tetrahydromethanopterin reductase-like flavin-dependent oxidoreductase (luciferase family)
MAASTIADQSGGRFILGLGSSHKAQVEPEHGVVYSKPLTRTRETVAVVRALIREGRRRQPRQRRLCLMVFDQHAAAEFRDRDLRHPPVTLTLTIPLW